MEIFNLKKLNDGEVKEVYQIKISDSFAALENRDDNVDVSRFGKVLQENTKNSAIV
jgi:hypothetical protein